MSSQNTRLIVVPHVVIIRAGEKYRCISSGFTEAEFQHTINKKQRLVLTHAEIAAEYDAGRLKIRNRRAHQHRTGALVEIPQLLGDLDDDERAEHERVEKYVKACWELPTTRSVIQKRINELAEELRDAQPPSPGKVLRWRDEHAQSGNCVRIVSGRRRCGHYGPRKESVVYECTYEYAAKTIGKDRRNVKPLGRKTIRTAVKAINKQLKPYNQSVSGKFVKGLLEALYSHADIERAKNGKSAARNKYAPIGNGRYGDFTNHIWQADHTIIDVRARLPMKAPFDKPFWLTIKFTLTVVVDSRSGLVLGFYLGTRPASQYTLQQAMIMAMLPKDELFRSLGISEPPAPIYGKGEWVYVDQGLEGVGDSTGTVLAGHGMKTLRLESHRPDLKGSVEAIFKTINDHKFHSMDGAAVRHRDRSILAEQEQALYNIRELNEIIARYFFIELPEEEIDRVGRTRLQIWRDGLAGPIIQPRTDPDYFVVSLMPRVPKSPVIGRHGIRLHHRDYDSEEFCAHRDEEGLNGRQCAAVYYVPSDLSRVYIKITPRSPLMLLRSSYMDQDEAIDVDAYLHARRQKEAENPNSSEADLVAAIDESADEIIKDFKHLQNIRHKTASRVLGADAEEVSGLMRIPEHNFQKTPGTGTSAHRTNPYHDVSALHDVDDDDIADARKLLDL